MARCAYHTKQYVGNSDACGVAPLVRIRSHNPTQSVTHGHAYYNESKDTSTATINTNATYIQAFSRQQSRFTRSLKKDSPLYSCDLVQSLSKYQKGPKISFNKPEYRRKCSNNELLKCGCGKAFKHQKKLKEHVFNHAGYKLLKCNTCEMTFTRKHQMTLHQQHCLQNIVEESFKCLIPTCALTFPTERGLKKHTDEHSGRRGKPSSKVAGDRSFADQKTNCDVLSKCVVLTSTKANKDKSSSNGHKNTSPKTEIAKGINTQVKKCESSGYKCTKTSTKSEENMKRSAKVQRRELPSNTSVYTDADALITWKKQLETSIQQSSEGTGEVSKFNAPNLMQGVHNIPSGQEILWDSSVGDIQGIPHEASYPATTIHAHGSLQRHLKADSRNSSALGVIKTAPVKTNNCLLNGVCDITVIRASAQSVITDLQPSEHSQKSDVYVVNLKCDKCKQSFSSDVLYRHMLSHAAEDNAHICEASEGLRTDSLVHASEKQDVVGLDDEFNSSTQPNFKQCSLDITPSETDALVQRGRLEKHSYFCSGSVGSKSMLIKNSSNHYEVEHPVSKNLESDLLACKNQAEECNSTLSKNRENGSTSRKNWVVSPICITLEDEIDPKLCKNLDEENSLVENREGGPLLYVNQNENTATSCVSIDKENEPVEKRECYPIPSKNREDATLSGTTGDKNAGGNPVGISHKKRGDENKSSKNAENYPVSSEHKKNGDTPKTIHREDTTSKTEVQSDQNNLQGSQNQEYENDLTLLDMGNEEDCTRSDTRMIQDERGENGSATSQTLEDDLEIVWENPMITKVSYSVQNSDEVRPFKHFCTGCKEYFQNSEALQTHTLQHAKRQADSSASDESDLSVVWEKNAKSEDSTVKFFCFICEDFLKSAMELQKHESYHKSVCFTNT